MWIRCVTGAVALLVCVVLLAGCHRPDDTASTGNSKASGVEREASDAAIAEVTKHWTKGADGWTTAKLTGSSFAGIRYVRQVRELTVEGVEPVDLTDSDKLNGFEWAGRVSLKQTPCREAGESGVVLEGMGPVTVMRQRGRWSQWVDYHPEALQVQKVKGQWQVQPDNALLTGKQPTADDFANAGVK